MSQPQPDGRFAEWKRIVCHVPCRAPNGACRWLPYILPRTRPREAPAAESLSHVPRSLQANSAPRQGYTYHITAQKTEGKISVHLPEDTTKGPCEPGTKTLSGEEDKSGTSLGTHVGWAAPREPSPQP